METVINEKRNEKTASGEEPYVLCDIGEKTTSFLKRGELRCIIQWVKLFRAEGRTVKRLDIVHDLATLQRLYKNHSGQEAGDDVDVLIEQCLDLSTDLEIDNTPVGVLKERVAVLGGISTTTTKGKTMSNQSTDDAATDAVVQDASAEVGAALTPPATAAATEASTTTKTAKAKKEKPVRKERESKTVQHSQILTDAAKGDHSEVLAKVEAAFQALTVSKSGKRRSDSQKWHVPVNIRQTADATAPVMMNVSLLWFGAIVTGTDVNNYNRVECARLAQQLGFEVYHEGALLPLVEDTKKEAKAETATAADAQASLPATEEAPVADAPEGEALPAE